MGKLLKYYMYGEPQIAYSVYSDGTSKGDIKAWETMKKLIKARDSQEIKVKCGFHRKEFNI